ncbi:homoserine O-succinyltransferase MetA [Thiohalomonas denitrificans]|uniref:homoserine O-succinyltransferase MetA n=1 Tax=Thiohalomonas denitrificans TaxID=415747 RepID=UPI0026EAAC7D|nr:homoserine O-succinyltransferase [Thiohalomonas denitrificans]
MPLVANTELPAFSRLRQEGQNVLEREVAVHQDIRELHVGLLNMMPDAALAATERQFFRLVGEANQIAQFYMHPFTLKELERGPDAAGHIERYYERFEDLMSEGLDALIITGANVQGPELSKQPFWKPLIEVIDWAYDNVTSTLCSCLTTHAVMEFRYGQKRRPLGFKRWGVYSHRVSGPHPLVAGVNTRFDVPHSRFNGIEREQFESAGCRVLAESKEAGVHLATSEDLFRLVFFQGHPEYDVISLLKEYKREVTLFGAGKCNDYPSSIDNYFTPQAEAILDEHRLRVCRARERGEPTPEFPEKLIAGYLDNTWHDTAEAIINKWIGRVYQLTHHDRKRPFKEGIDPNDPFGLRG